MNADAPAAGAADRGSEPPLESPGTPEPFTTPPVTPPPAPLPLDAETARAVEEARRAFLLAAEKAGIAARALSSQVRAGAFEAIDELAQIARTAHDRVREMASAAGAAGHLSAPMATTEERGGSEDASSRLEPHLAGALAYAGWAMTGILFYLLTDRTERFVRFHALQSILLTAAVVVVGGSVLAVPLIGQALFAASAIGFFLVWILAMRRAFRRERYPLPFIGEIARAHVDRRSEEGW